MKYRYERIAPNHYKIHLHGSLLGTVRKVYRVDLGRFWEVNGYGYGFSTRKACAEYLYNLTTNGRPQ